MRILIIIGMLSFANFAHAQYYGNNSYHETTTTYGNMSNTNISGSDGYNAHVNTSNYGNMQISNGYDNNGNSVHCTTNTYGNTQTTNCY